MALSDEDKTEFKGLMSEWWSETKSAEEEAAAKRKEEESKNNEGDKTPQTKSFAERLLGL